MKFSPPLSHSRIPLAAPSTSVLTMIAHYPELLRGWESGPKAPSMMKTWNDMSALKASIKDHVQGEVTLQVLHVHIDGSQIIVIEVAPAATKPVIIRQDNYLYARKGASNRKVPPDEWRTILNSNAEAPFFGRAM